MRCNWLDLLCHGQNAAQGAAWQVQNAIWEWWASVGWINKALIVIGLWFAVLYLTRGIIALAHRVGGWKAVAGYAAATLGAVLWLFLKLQPKKPKRDDFTGEVDGDDARLSPRRPRFRVPPPRKGKRRFRPEIEPNGAWERLNPNTGRWEQE